MKKIDLLKCLSIITKDGLRTQKFKNSHLQLLSPAEEGRRGLYLLIVQKQIW